MLYMYMYNIHANNVGADSICHMYVTMDVHYNCMAMYDSVYI